MTAAPVQNDSAEERRKSAEQLVGGILSAVEFEDFVRATLFAFTPIHNQNRQCTAAAHFVGVDTETVRRWAHGITTPKARDFWPLGIVAILQHLPVETQQQVMATITGMVGDA